MTQENSRNCGAWADALVRDSFDKGIFYRCFLHILNLACQAAIRVYDPEKTNSPFLREGELFRTIGDLRMIPQLEIKC